MKKIIVILILAIFSISSAMATDIPDGWYSATVKYTNYSTGTYATYTLNVRVSYGKVKEIDFGNGGSVHDGYNNSGYIYSGGYLSYDTDYNGTITSAYATVNVYSNGDTKYFKITIE
jgi:hypothetical protein